MLPTKLIADGMGLLWNGVEGKFFGEDGQLIAVDPSVSESGPHSLLMREDALSGFLDKTDCELLWTVLGEKQFVGGDTLPEKWKGRVEISGAFRYINRGIQGQLSTRLKSRG